MSSDFIEGAKYHSAGAARPGEESQIMIARLSQSILA
jgi:hypothetical protein